jgi:hypothetical protein
MIHSLAFYIALHAQLEPKATPPLSFERTIELSPREQSARDLFMKVNFELNFTDEQTRAMIAKIDQGHSAYPVNLTMWQNWKFAALVRMRAFDEAIEVGNEIVDRYGVIDLEWVLSDPLVQPIAEHKSWSALIQKTRRKYSNYLDDLSPIRLGLDPAVNKTKILEMQTQRQPGSYERLASWNSFPTIKKPGRWVWMTHRYTNTTTKETSIVPYYLYIPKSYRSSRSHPMNVYMYGGWINAHYSRAFGQRSNIEDNPTFAPINFLDPGNTVQVIPLFNRRQSPLKPNGIECLRSILAEVKSMVNIDDDRCTALGFSDGGTTCFEIVRSSPSEFAATFPICGFPLFNLGFRNLGSRPIYSFSGELDNLYPASQISKLYDKAKSEAPSWHPYLVKNSGHEAWFLNDRVMPKIFSLLNKAKRNPLQPTLQIECPPNESSKLDWLEITEVSPDKHPADWHNSLTIMGKAKADEQPKEIICNPGFGMVKAVNEGNIFRIQASRVSQLKVYLHTKMVDITKPVVIEVNGKQIYDAVIKVNPDYAIDKFLENFDRKALWIAEISVKVAD